MSSRRLVLKSLVVASLLLMATGSRSDEPTKAEKFAADPMLGKEAGQVREDNGLKMKLIWCPPGFFTMEQIDFVEKPAEVVNKSDSDDEDVDGKKVDDQKISATVDVRQATKITPVKVSLTRGYWLGRYEVTQAEWTHVMATEPWKGQTSTKEGDDFPASYVNWDDAMEFCRNFTERERMGNRLPEGWEYTLPTEAQWEWACRARTKTKFSFGNEESILGEYMWFFGNTFQVGEEYAHRVGQKKPNRWDFYDMHGNVWEWCQDWYQSKLPGGRDPVVTTKNTYRVSRGGGWNGSETVVTSAFHSGGLSDRRNFNLGFRLTLSPVR